jgi:hypothetical protein
VRSSGSAPQGNGFDETGRRAKRSRLSTLASPSTPARRVSTAGAWPASRGAASNGRGRARAAGKASPSSSARRRCRPPRPAPSGARSPSRPRRKRAPALWPRLLRVERRTVAARRTVATRRERAEARGPTPHVQRRAAAAAVALGDPTESPQRRAKPPARVSSLTSHVGSVVRTKRRSAGSSMRANASARRARRTRSRNSVCASLASPSR